MLCGATEVSVMLGGRKIFRGTSEDDIDLDPRQHGNVTLILLWKSWQGLFNLTVVAALAQHTCLCD